MRILWLPLILLASLSAATPVFAEDDESLYRLPDGFAPPGETEFDDPAALIESSIAALVDRGPVWDRRAARRTLAALGDAALPTVVERLRTSNRRVRRDLVSAVGDMRSPAADALLLAATRDSSWSVREAALIALGLRGRAEALPAVRALLEDSVWRVRAAVVDALRRLAQTAPSADGDAVRNALASRLADRDREVRRKAAWAILRLQHEPALHEAFQTLWNGPRQRRPKIIRELPRTDRPAIVAILEQIMADSDEDLAFAAAERFAAIRGLEVLETPRMRERLRDALLRSTGKASLVVRRLRAEALPFLIECLEQRGSDVRRRMPGQEKERARHILDLMASLGGDRAVPYFRQIIEETDDDYLLRHAIVVGRLAFPEKLESSFEKRYRDRRTVAYRRQGLLLLSLARTNPELAAPLLAEAAASGTMDLHFAVIDAIRAVGDRCDRPTLLREILRTSSNKRVLAKALPLAARVVGEAAEPHILPRLEDPDYRIRTAAVTALTARKSEANAAAIRALFRASAPVMAEEPGSTGDDPVTLQRKEALRRGILKALPLVASKPDFAFLAEALRAEEPLVRERAAGALAADGSPEAGKIVVAALETETDIMARTALLRALVRCEGDLTAATIDSILVSGDRMDRQQILKSLSVGDRPVPDSVRTGLFEGDWDDNLRQNAATALAEKGDDEDLDALVKLIAEGAATPALEDAVLQALGEREATAQAPGLIALLPAEPLDDIEPDRQGFTLALIESLGRIGSPAAAGPLRELLSRNRYRADEDLARIDAFRREALGLAAQALARIDPTGAMPDLIDVLLDPVVAREHWDRGVGWLSTRDKLHDMAQSVCYGLQRVEAPTLAAAVKAELGTRHRSGSLLELPPGYLAAVADQLAKQDRKRPRKAAAAAIRAAMLRIPAGVTRHSFDAARALATWSVFRGTAREIIAAAEAARRDLVLDPGLAKTAEQRRREADFLSALALAGQGLATKDPEERLKLFHRAADTDTTNVDVAWYLAWCGLTRGVDFEAVKAWTRRATALSASGDSQRWTVLDLQGVVLRRDGQLAQAGTYLERAWESSRMAKSGMAAYHFAQALCELDRLPLARAVLLEALEKDDTYWANARREPMFKRLGTEDGVEQLIEDAKKTFD